MKKSVHYVTGCFFFALLAAVLLLTGSRAEAATSYRKLFQDYEKTVDKVGGTWFKEDNGKLYYSKDGSSYRLAAEGYHIYFTNGSLVFYADSTNYKLYRFSCRTGKTKALKSLPNKARNIENDSYHVSAIYGGQVYLTRGSFDAWHYWTYQYNMKTGKLRMALKTGMITGRSSKYVVVEHDYRSDVSPVRISLYRLTSTGMKKIVRLANKAHSAVFLKGHVYYGAYSGDRMTKVTICRRKQDGSSLKKLGTIRSSSMIIPYRFTTKYCLVNISGSNYRFSYKTKKLTKV